MAANRNIYLSVIFRIVVSAIALFVAVSIFIFLKNTAPKPAASDSANAAPRVEVMQAQAVPVRRQWEGFGTAAAMETVNVPSRVTATVVERPDAIRAGRAVKQGQLVVRLDDTDFARQVEISSRAIQDIEAQLKRLEIEESSWSQRAEFASEQVKLARADYDRVRDAFQRDAAKQRELDQAQQALLNAQQAEVSTREEFEKIAPRRASLQAQREREEATRKIAAQNVERSTIVSPIDGVLQSVDVDLGENVAAGQRVARVVNLNRIEVPLLLAASARPFVSVGDAVTLRDGGASSNDWPAHVTRIAPEDNESTRTMRVFVEVDQKQGSEIDAISLPPGKFVQGTVQTNERQARWVVPRRAIDGQRVLLVEEGAVKSRGVDVDFQVQGEMPMFGLPDRLWAVLRDPLPQNALVVLDSSRALAEGSAVTPVMHTAAEASAATNTPPGDPTSTSEGARQ